MTTQLHPHVAMPTPEEIRALMARAHRERNQAIRRLFSGLFFASKPSDTETEHTAGHKAAACG